MFYKECHNRAKYCRCYYTYYDDAGNPTEFEKNNVLLNYPEFGDKLIIGKLCAIA